MMILLHWLIPVFYYLKTKSKVDKKIRTIIIIALANQCFENGYNAFIMEANK
jgi:hypothetical protein